MRAERYEMNDCARSHVASVPSLLAGGGELGSLIAAHDWSKTPLGPIEAWPQSLMTAVGVVVHSPVPIVMLWGEDGIMIYNDAYSVFAGGRHPHLEPGMHVLTKPFAMDALANRIKDLIAQA